MLVVDVILHYGRIGEKDGVGANQRSEGGIRQDDFCRIIYTRRVPLNTANWTTSYAQACGRLASGCWVLNLNVVLLVSYSLTHQPVLAAASQLFSTVQKLVLSPVI